MSLEKIPTWQNVQDWANNKFAEDGDTQPPEDHGNEAHPTDFAEDGDEQPPESHGSSSHYGSTGTENGFTSVEYKINSATYRDETNTFRTNVTSPFVADGATGKFYPEFSDNDCTLTVEFADGSEVSETKYIPEGETDTVTISFSEPRLVTRVVTEYDSGTYTHSQYVDVVKPDSHSHSL